MAFNGSGTYSLVAGNPVVTGTTISSTWANNTLSDIASNGLSICLTKDGQQTPTANIPMGGFRLTGLGSATALTDAPTVAQVQNRSFSSFTPGGTANAITGTLSPTPAAYATGQRVAFTPTATNTGATTINLSSLGNLNVQQNGLPLAGQEIVKNQPVELAIDSSASAAYIVGNSAFAPMALLKTIVQGRLTATAGTPITTTDVVSCSQMIFTPFRGNSIALYATADSSWKVIQFSEVSTAIPASANTVHDWFGFLSATNGLNLKAVSWTNDTTRSDALVLQNGIYVASANPAWRYLGTTRTTASAGIVEDSFAKRWLWNYYNRVVRGMRVLTTDGSWNYSTATWRQSNANAANQLDFVIGVSEDEIRANATGSAFSSGATFRAIRTGIGVDSTSSIAGTMVGMSAANVNAQVVMVASYVGYPGIGRHYLAWLEQGGGADTQTFYGNNSSSGNEQLGIQGELRG